MRGPKEDELYELLSFVLGGDWGKKPEFEDDQYEMVRCIRGGEFRNWYPEKGSTAVLRKVKKASLEKRKLKVGDILLEISGGGPDQPVGRVRYIDEEVVKSQELPLVATNFLRLLRPSSKVNSKYLYYFLKEIYLSGKVTAYQGGANNLRNLRWKEFKKIDVPVFSEEKQGEVVEQLDRLLENHRTLQTSLTRLPSLLADFREAVISSNLPDNCIKPLGGELEDVRYGTSKKCTFEPIGAPVLRIPNIKDGEVDNRLLKYAEFNEKELEKLELRKGDVLVIRSNGSVSIVGRSAYVNAQNEGFLFAGYLIRLRPSKTLSGKYLSYTLSSSVVRAQIVEMAHSSSGVNNINSTQLKSIMLPIPSIEEQDQIVRRIEALFSLADLIEARMETLKVQVADLPQAILAKAFRGEL